MGVRLLFADDFCRLVMALTGRTAHFRLKCLLPGHVSPMQCRGELV